MRITILSTWLGVCVGLAACGGRPGLPVMTSAASDGSPSTTTTTGAAGSTVTSMGQGIGGASGGSTGPATGGSPGGGGSAGAGFVYIPTGGACSGPPPSPLCSLNADGKLTPATMDAYTAAISGRWLLCGNHESVFGVDAGDIGVEITPDHHFYKLYAAQGGAVIRGAGAGEEGTWALLDISFDAPLTFQLNFEVTGVEYGGVYTHPVLTTTPRTMYLDNNGVFRGTYVIDPSVPTSAPRCPKQVDLTRSGACTPPAVMMPVCSNDNPRGLALGRWSRCGGTMPGAPAHDGIEFTADGGFFFLHLDATGALIRGTAATDVGAASFDPGCQLTTDLRTTSGGSWLSSSVFFDTSPRQLWIYTEPESGDPERYTFVGP
jgi:hypothetical protein